MRRLPLALLLSSYLATVVSALPPVVNITECGQEVPRGSVGMLANDLDCSAVLRCWQCDGSSTGTRCRPGNQACTTEADCPAPTCPDVDNCIGPVTADYSFCASTTGAYLDRSTLDLNGHTIEGGYAGVICGAGRCRIENGTITRNRNAIQNSGKLDLLDLMLSDNDDRAVEFAGTPVRPVQATRVTIANNGNEQAGLVGGQVTLTDVTLLGRGSGVLGFKSIKGTRVVATGDANTTSSSALSTYYGRVSVTGLTASGWERAIDSSIIIVRNSQLSDNGCDLFSDKPPHAANTTCEHSCRTPFGTWGVCSGD